MVGDNIRSPGAPDYKKYLLEGEGKKLFSTEARRRMGRRCRFAAVDSKVSGSKRGLKSACRVLG